VFYSGRQAVAAKDVVAIIEEWEGELREYKKLTGLDVDNTLKLLNLERMLPESIAKMLQTVEITDYDKAKEYAIKQAKAQIKNMGSKGVFLDLNEHEAELGGKKNKKDKLDEEPPEQEEPYSVDSRLAWIGKGPGKGGKGSGTKGGKGPFQGNCHYSGVYGHRTNECRKMESDLKGKGRGQGQQQTQTWGNPYPSKGKGNKGSWNPGGGKGNLWARR